MGRFERQVDLYNQNAANIYEMAGSLEQLGYYICGDNRPKCFSICGDSNYYERYYPLIPYFRMVMGNIPVIVIHNNSTALEQMLQHVWNERVSTGLNSPLWLINNNCAEFEPFYLMNDSQIVEALRSIAKELGYEVTARFDRVINAHLRIIKINSAPVSLSWLNYLSGFNDMSLFQYNVMSLPCSKSESEGIWGDLCTDSMEFDLFRTVVKRISADISQCGWQNNGSVSTINCARAIDNNAILSVAINSAYSDIFLTYIAEELRPYNNRQYVLILDNIPLGNNKITDILLSNKQLFLGIITDNIINTITDNEKFKNVMEKMDTMLIFKHSTGTVASALSELIGEYESLRTSTSVGVNRGYGRMFARDTHDGTNISYEMRKRVEPGDITGLQTGQAIVYNMDNDEVIFFYQK